ncbi:tripartite tricarboxylate transporter substrate binding protein [Curvibacter sp. HBC61]|uniref:Tripartite tricarboxylate transporter substrate binding protein n=1 Tax=Curvibacter cyanobacteriorum TaxID=3026422 RepID=A0ABT5N1X5_9BURK|nr:tripartite tricarboxylate transporter substrate binding protein [Curvibacter sp. HBC61]MDD0840301.1 tripartite tricarboxylate transporter substrate binding protein [Curvibacter sp. HBC61]
MSAPRLNRRHFTSQLGAAALALSALPARAAWPEKPIRLVVTFPAGGASDIVARLMADQLARKLGQAVVVDNRPGAGGSVGGQLVHQASPDGYTLMLSNSTPISIGPFALDKQPYDPVEGFTHVAMLGTAPCVLMATPSAPIRTIADLESQARKTGRLDFGSGGPASIGHIYGELMRKSMGVNLVHVPYRGGAPMTTDLMSGVIPVGIDVLTAYVPYFRSGQLVPLAVTSAARSPLVPEVPSVVEFGYSKLVLDNFFGLSGPPGLPADTVARLNAACNEVLALPDVKRKMLELGVSTQAGSSAAFSRYVREQVALLAPTVKAAGTRL